MTTLLLTAATFVSTLATASCPLLSGDYLCLTSFSTKSEPWSLVQSVNATGDVVYSFDNNDYISDGVARLDPSVSYSLSVRATCKNLGGNRQLVIDEIGDLLDRGSQIHFENQNIIEMNAKDQLISRYSHDGSLIDTMICSRR